MVAIMGLTLSFPDIVTTDPHKGIGLGLGWDHLKELGKEKKVVPEFEVEPSHDPHLGFEGQRKLRGEGYLFLRNLASSLMMQQRPQRNSD